MTSLSTGGGSARSEASERAYGGKIWACVLAGSIGTSAFTNASAGTIGGITTNWNSWQEVAGLPAARDALGAGGRS